MESNFNAELMDRLSKAERAEMFLSTEVGKWFQEYLKSVKGSAVNKFLRTPAEQKEVIMECQLLYKIADDFMNTSMKRIREEGELAFEEAKFRGILTVPVPKIQEDGSNP